MKRTLSWILISLIAFALGLAATFICLNRFKVSVEQSEAVSLPAQKADILSEQQPILAYCELANNPEKYNGKIVRINAKLYFMMHGYFFLSKNCDGETKQTAVLFPSGEAGAEIENKIAKDTGLDEYQPWGFPEIIAIGRFTRVEPSRKGDSMEENTYLHFEILEIEKASKQ